MAKKSIVIMALILMLTACQPTAKNAITSIPTPSITTKPKSTTQTTPPTFKKLPTITSTPTEIPTSSLTFRCLKFTTKIPDNAQINGVIVLEQEMYAKKSILLNIRTQENLYLLDAYQLRVSTDGLRLAYIDISGEIKDWQLIVKTKVGEQYSIPWESEWDGIAQWLDNDRLLINRRRWTGQGPFLLDSIVVLNPTTLEKQELLPQYPHMYTDTKPVVKWSDFAISRTIYNLSLSRVIYPATAENGTPIVLWDITKDTSLFVANSDGYLYGSTPRWSPDQNKFLIDLRPIYFENSPQPNPGNELYSVTSSGEINRLTYLTNTFKTQLHDYSWSPDGRYIAFWLKIEPSQFNDERLAILDINTNTITNYCVPGDPINGAATAPVWSLDGHLLAVESFDPQNKFHRLVFLVDTTQGIYTEIAENVKPIGWMVSP